jgi:glycosyltransferase involved in cell wall biosynthesis
MQVVDSLDVGGTETVAVNLANRLPRQRFRNYLCSTRPGSTGAPLAASLQPDVHHLALDRKSRFDVGAMMKFRKFVRDENIRLLHVHGSSLFFGKLASLLGPTTGQALIWHDHYGRCELNDRSARLYRMAIAGASGVIAVNQQLVDWACDQLHVSPEQVWYVPNFVAAPKDERTQAPPDLPGTAGNRIICVANLRPQKNHVTLLHAIAEIRRERPEVQLLLAGGAVEKDYAQMLRQEVARLELERNVTFLGQTAGIQSILRACDVGVLSSTSEGLPLSLLEYGWAGLPSVATSVGQCVEVLNHGKAGILVKPGSSSELVTALSFLLDSPAQRVEYGRRFREFVQQKYDPTVIVNQICDIYDRVLSTN